MEFTRREAFKKIAAGGAAATLISVSALTGKAEAEELQRGASQPIGMLYDTTRCIGCQSCVVACADANDLGEENVGIHRTAADLNHFTKNIIKLYKPADAKVYSYVKQQCMHCVDPACAAGCMFKGLRKDPTTGIVTWNSKVCVGCRYCEISCPHHVPKFQWQGFNPKIVKCELCKERIAKGDQPACTSVCPAKAVIFGKREDLLAEAKKRIKDHPGKYFADRVYGEQDGGGTQVLYLSHVPFEAIGLPTLADESIPSKYLKWQKRAYSYLVVPVVLYASMVGIVRKNFAEHKEHLKHEEAKTGLRSQL